MFALAGCQFAFQQAWRLLTHRYTRYVLAWLLAGWSTFNLGHASWHYFDRPGERPGYPPFGNNGHVSIDFGGQWIMGRMLNNGSGMFLYQRAHQRQALRDSYPVEDQEPGRDPKEPSDAEAMLTWFIGSEKGPSGPLYPPINAFWYYPLGGLHPHLAYRLRQIIDLPLLVSIALGISLISRGRIWMPVSLTLVMYYPGLYGNWLLGQNATLTLAILVWGWVLLARGHQAWGGLVWGWLAFKPVWAVSFFLVLLLSRRWRACLVMGLCGLAQIALTLPFVGVQSWLDWLAIGREASLLYDVSHKWINMSRDLLGIPRRWLDFNLPESQRDRLWAAIAGWALIGFVLEFTVRLTQFRCREVQTSTGPGAAFLLMGGWLTCYHFMYYDVLLTFLPLMLLFTAGGSDYLRSQLPARQPLQWQAWFPRWWVRLDTNPQRPSACATAVLGLLRLPARVTYGLMRNPVELLLLAALLVIENPARAVSLEWMELIHDWVEWFWIPVTRTDHSFGDFGTPWNTYVLILLWLWCAWAWTRETARAGRLGGESSRVLVEAEGELASERNGQERADNQLVRRVSLPG